MPKVTNTRKQRANELLERLKRGPSLSAHRMGMHSAREAEAQVKIWLGSWVIHEVIDLVPELRRARNKQREQQRKEQQQ